MSELKKTPEMAWKLLETQLVRDNFTPDVTEALLIIYRQYSGLHSQLEAANIRTEKIIDHNKRLVKQLRQQTKNFIRLNNENDLLRKENLAILEDRPLSRKTIKFMYIDFDRKLDEVKQERYNLKTLLQEANKEINLLRTGYCDSYNKKSCKHQNDTLQSQINHLKFQLGETCLKIAEYERQPLEEVKAWCDGLLKRYTDLQAAYAVVRGTLERSRNIMIFHAARCPMNIPNNFSGSEEHLAEYRAVYQRVIPEALSITPHEAGASVQELVKAVEWMKSTANSFRYKAPEQIDAIKLIAAMYATANIALNKFKRGNGGEL